MEFRISKLDARGDYLEIYLYSVGTSHQTPVFITVSKRFLPSLVYYMRYRDVAYKIGGDRNGALLQSHEPNGEFIEIPLN